MSNSDGECLKCKVISMDSHSTYHGMSLMNGAVTSKMTITKLLINDILLNGASPLMSNRITKS